MKKIFVLIALVLLPSQFAEAKPGYDSYPFYECQSDDGKDYFSYAPCNATDEQRNKIETNIRRQEYEKKQNRKWKAREDKRRRREEQQQDVIRYQNNLEKQRIFNKFRNELIQCEQQCQKVRNSCSTYNNALKRKRGQDYTIAAKNEHTCTENLGICKENCKVKYDLDLQ
ncbi:MAG: hypothetical protein HQL50_05205 [Magnetococcales bacterium]|nr:hypothetical protein [Magnetococcales bacterium]